MFKRLFPHPSLPRSVRDEIESMRHGCQIELLEYRRHLGGARTITPVEKRH